MHMEALRLSMAVALLFRSKSCSTRTTGTSQFRSGTYARGNPVHPEAAPYEGSARKAHVSGVGLHILPMMQASRGRHGSEPVDIFYKQIGTSCKWWPTGARSCRSFGGQLRTFIEGVRGRRPDVDLVLLGRVLSVEDLLRYVTYSSATSWRCSR